jgi:hypothetical protein
MDMITYRSDLHYPDDHWAVVDCQVRTNPVDVSHLPCGFEQWKASNKVDKYRVGILLYFDIPVIVKVNPTDNRGYRLIATVSDEKDPRNTFNRRATEDEQGALGTALSFLRNMFDSMGMIGQSFVAGNNCHVVTEGGAVEVGTPKEPSMIHGHVLGRGRLGFEYLPSVPLKGPPMGEEFSLRGPKERFDDEIVYGLVNGIRKLIAISPFVKNVRK